jgi:hypothetical protein
MTTWGLRWASPHPGLSTQVELRGGDTGGLRDLLGRGLALPSERIAAEEPPPALLQIEPACSSGNEDVMDARMPFQPSARLETGVTGEIIADDEDLPRGIVGFDVGEQSNIALRVARSRRAWSVPCHRVRAAPRRPRFSRAHASRVQRRFDAVTVGRPAGGGIKGARDYRSEFVGTDGRRPLGGRGGVADDRRSDCGQSLCREACPNCGSVESRRPHAAGWCGSGCV